MGAGCAAPRLVGRPSEELVEELRLDLLDVLGKMREITIEGGARA